MADASYRFQQPGAQQFFFQHPQNHQRHLARNGSPVSNGRIGAFSTDTSSPTRSPIPQSPAHSQNPYAMYSQAHQQSQHTLLNGNHGYGRFNIPLNLAPKHQHQNHHQHHAQQHHHSQQQQQGQPQHHAHSVHPAHSAALNHQHTYSSGGLPTTTPQFTPVHLQSGTPDSVHEEIDEAQMSEHWQQQLQAAAESRQSNIPHAHASNYARLPKLPRPNHLNNASDEQAQERPRTNGNAMKKRKEYPWTEMDMGGIGLRVLNNALFNYTFLEKLFINHNSLSQLPPAIGSLRSLVELDISHNNISEIPPEIGMLVNLKTLSLVDNNVRTFPGELGSLYKLDMLAVEGNPLEEGLKRQIMEEGTKGLITWLRENASVRLPPTDRDWIVLDDTPVPENGPPQDKFSILNYNTLCDKYATSSQYGYTASKYLAWDFRKQNILNELKDRNADIICLQEIDMENFDEYFRPALAYDDYKGAFWPKSRARTMGEKEARLVDGCATFYKASKFILLDKQVIDFANSAINRPDMKGEHDIFNRVMPRDNIAVVTFLENRVTGSRVIVVNVHIFWDPLFEDVKLVQTAILMESVTRLSREYTEVPPCTDKTTFRLSSDITEDSVEPEPGPSLEYSSIYQIPIVICGDFNSTRDSGVYQLLSQGYVPPKHRDLAKWTYGSFTRDGISHPLSMKSSYGNIGELPFTNYTPGFTDVIDYIWYSTNTLQVTALLGQVDPEYLQRVPGFPNDHFPSDHLALLTEFLVKERKERKVVEVDFGNGSNSRSHRDKDKDARANGNGNGNGTHTGSSGLGSGLASSGAGGSSNVGASTEPKENGNNGKGKT